MSQKANFTLLIIVLLNCTVHGQIEKMPPYEVYDPEYYTYRFEKDLYSFNQIEYMFKDSKKKIWLSTIHDLKRTNGYHYFNISEILNNKVSFKGHIIDGQKWNDSTQYLVERVDNHSLRSHALYSSSAIEMVQLDTDRESKGKMLFYDLIWNENAYEIWSDSLNSLSVRIITPDGFLKGESKLPFLNGQVTAFSVTNDLLWIVIDKRKIYSFELSDNEELTMRSEIQSTKNIQLFHSDRFDNIWVTLWDGVYQIRLFEAGYDFTPVLAIRNMEKVFEDQNGNLIFGSVSFPNTIGSAYLYLREGGRWISLRSLINKYHDLHFFAGNNFRNEIFLAAKNNFSALRFSENPLADHIVDRFVPGNRVSFESKGLYKSDSMFYVLTSNQGLLTKNLVTGREKPIHFKNPETNQPLQFDCAQTIEVDTSGRLWFSSCDGTEGSFENYLISYFPQTQTSKITQFRFPVSAIQMGLDSILWVAIQSSDISQSIIGYNIHREKISNTYDLTYNIGKINDIEIINQDSLLLGTDFGLFNYSFSTNHTEQLPIQENTEIQTTIFSIFHYDNKYFLAGHDGLFIYSPGISPTTQYSIENGLRNNIITSVFRERENKYWLGTFYGVSMINLDENLILNYSTLDGLPDNQFNLYSYFQDETGFYLGYSNGVIRLNLRDSMISYFSDFELDHALVYNRENEKPDVLFPEKDRFTIPADISYFKIFPGSYASYFIDYFYYKLINTTQNDTIYFSSTNGVIMSKLEAGSYNFSLLTYDRYGNEIPISKKFNVTVNQHFHEALWFRILILLLLNIVIGSLIYGWLRTRSRKKRQTNEMAKRLSELELKVLQAQLNPHFIFNTISAIQYYIQEHDDVHADLYLTSFSRLMRMYLDSSKSSYIHLNTEIALLTHYIDLEIMVSDGQIKAHYEIDPAIDRENIVIPTMMLQPFVENAIQHGLFHKTDEGNIFIRFILMSENILQCEIEDDGIGRSKSGAINQSQAHKPTSRAYQIINEKLEVLKATQNLKIEIEIIDKYHEGKAKGTLVQIQFPIIKAKDVNSLVKL